MSRFIAVTAILFASVLAIAQDNVIIKTITINGANNINRDAILAVMTSKEGGILQPSELLNDEDRVMGMGYFQDVKILRKPLANPNEVELVVELEENPIIREILFLGNTIISSEDLTAIVTDIQSLGRIYNNQNAGRIVAAVQSAYEDTGYIGQIDEIGPDPDSLGTLRIVIIEPSIREIRLIGLHRTQHKVVYRIMKTKAGEPFSPTLLRRDREELASTFWFEMIENPRLIETEDLGVFDLELEFTEARTGQINGGIALDPQSRLVGFVSYSDSNFRGLGQSVGVNLSQATVGGGASAEVAFGNKFYDARDTSMNVRVYSRVVYNFTNNTFGGSGNSFGNSQFNERRTGGNLTFSRPFARVNRGTVGFRFEQIITLDFQETGADNFIQQDGTVFALQFGVSKDTRHPSNEPFEGELISLFVEPSYSDITKVGGPVSTFDDILGPNFYLRNSIEYRRYFSKSVPPNTPVDQPRHVIAIRARYGFVTGDVPFFEQMFAGGLNSLRGYANQRFWGKQSLTGTVEYRYPIQKNFSLIGFTDYGGAWGGYPGIQSFSQSSSADFHLGYGVGVSFRTPIGPIRIDFAFNDQGGSRTHFAFGTSF